MNATKGQAQYLAKKLERFRTELLYIFPNMKGYSATCKVRGDKSLPVIEITWYPGYTSTNEKLPPKIVKQFNENWKKRHQEIFEQLAAKAHIPRGRPQALTTFTFRHKAGYLKE